MKQLHVYCIFIFVYGLVLLCRIQRGRLCVMRVLTDHLSTLMKEEFWPKRVILAGPEGGYLTPDCAKRRRQLIIRVNS